MENHFLPEWLEKDPVFGLEMKLAWRRFAGRLRLNRLKSKYKVLNLISLSVLAIFIAGMCVCLVRCLLYAFEIFKSGVSNPNAMVQMQYAQYFSYFLMIFGILWICFYCFCIYLGSNSLTNVKDNEFFSLQIIASANAMKTFYELLTAKVVLVLPILFLFTVAGCIEEQVRCVFSKETCFAIYFAISAFSGMLMIFLLSVYLGQYFRNEITRWLGVTGILVVLSGCDGLVFFLLVDYEYTNSASELADFIYYCRALIPPLGGLTARDNPGVFFILVFIAIRIFYAYLLVLLSRDRFVKRVTM